MIKVEKDGLGNSMMRILPSASLVKSTLEYSSVVWLPSYRCHVDLLECVQRDFFLFSLRGLRWDSASPLPPFNNRLEHIDLPTLQKKC